jgi:hypothetical protein
MQVQLGGTQALKDLRARDGVAQMQAELLEAHQDPKQRAAEALAAALEATDEAPRKVLRGLKSGVGR